MTWVGMDETIFLPTLNACFNLLATLCLLAGYWSIKKLKNKELHRKWMIAAFIFSAFFLAFYLYYHYQVGSKSFPELGWIKTLYLIILIPHVILATAMVPFILLTFYFAFKENWTSHRRVAKITFPIWVYVSITGVIIYLMLYQLFPSPLS